MAGTALLGLYAEVDAACARYLDQRPSSRCPPGCHLCCARSAPLVSAAEAEQVALHLHEQLHDVEREATLARAMDLRRHLEQGGDDDFPCPLLSDGQCLVYASRPLACRTFGHSARCSPGGHSAHPDDGDQVVPFTCDLLRPHLDVAALPVLPYRVAWLRERLGLACVVDSYLPLWLATAPEDRQVRAVGTGGGVMTASRLPRPKPRQVAR